MWYLAGASALPAVERRYQQIQLMLTIVRSPITGTSASLTPDLTVYAPTFACLDRQPGAAAGQLRHRIICDIADNGSALALDGGQRNVRGNWRSHRSAVFGPALSAGGLSAGNKLPS